jgi:hypothetical protein
MSIASRIQEIEGHIGDIYDTLELGGDSTQNKNIVNINSEIKREYKDFLANGTDTLWNNWNKVNGTGESLTLNNTIKAKMKIDLKGNTSQEGTPTPDSPQDIHTVSGDNTIKVEGRNILNLNRTLGYPSDTTASNTTPRTFDTSTYVVGMSSNNYYYPNNVVSYSISDNVIKVKSANNVYGVSFPMKLDKGTYKLTFDFTSGNISFVSLTIYNSNNLYDTYQNISSDGTFTIDNDNTNILLTFKSINNVENTFTNVMLSRGTSTQTYTPYQGTQIFPLTLGDTELCKIGDYQDSIVKDNGKWYLNKQIGKVVLDGSENWSLFFSTQGIFTRNISSPAITNTSTPNCLSDNFLGVSRNQIRNNLATADNQCSLNVAELAIAYKSISTVNDFKTWLSTHNTIVYYPLATPTYTEITDTTLINQLEAIKLSYNEQTNISQENNDKPFILDVTALENYEEI